ncbi:MAG: hypothetical protein AUH85_07255 [Chloroflexi bacterium 13_1_40CM_4_68_4]|nr:MAG: hypothetical protein AUH85_07255 [Chloroflexi bacterium 13_1_40CM_4_68_4]
MLSDGRLRLFVNGTVGLVRDFTGKTPGQNESRMVSYVYGPAPYRVIVPEPGPDCRPCPVAHFTVTVEGSGPPVTLGAVGYSRADARDLVRDAASPVKVEFSPSSGSPPFAVDATMTFAPSAAQETMVVGVIVVVADNGAATEVVPLSARAGGGGAARPACQLGVEVPLGGCYVPGSSGPDGNPLSCVPLAAMPIDRQPPACAPYYGH